MCDEFNQHNYSDSEIEILNGLDYHYYYDIDYNKLSHEQHVEKHIKQYIERLKNKKN
jgi:hypothetical protein